MSNIIASHANEIIFAFATGAGMVAHYIKKKLKDETSVNIGQWFGSANLPGSILSIGSALTIIIAALSNGIINEAMSFWSVVYMGIVTGLAVDSTTNSDGTKNTEVHTEVITTKEKE